MVIRVVCLGGFIQENKHTLNLRVVTPMNIDARDGGHSRNSADMRKRVRFEVLHAAVYVYEDVISLIIEHLQQSFYNLEVVVCSNEVSVSLQIRINS